MKKIIGAFLVLIMMLTLFSCGESESTSTEAKESTGTVSTNASESTEVSKDTVTAEEEEKVEVDSKFGNRLDAYQGTWENIEDAYGFQEWLVIVGEDIYYYSRSRLTSDEKYDGYIGQYTFRIDSNDDLIGYSYISYPISMDDDGNIEFNNDIYEKVSDEQNIPTKWEPEIGMTEVQVRLSTWGNPNEINRTTTADSVIEEWVYSFGNVYLTDGVVTSIEEKGIK